MKKLPNINEIERVLFQRRESSNEEHHLFPNNGKWWMHFTVHMKDKTTERVRFSLKTGNLPKAQELRDNIINDVMTAIANRETKKVR